MEKTEKFESKKIDANTMEFMKPVTITYPSVTFERGYLENQRDNIIKIRDEFVAARQAELDEINGYLKIMDEAGIVSKKNTPVQEEVPVQAEVETKKD